MRMLCVLTGNFKASGRKRTAARAHHEGAAGRGRSEAKGQITATAHYEEGR